MKMNVITPNGHELNIEEITLLSADEYKAYKERIQPLGDYWWLRSPGNDSFYAAFVYDIDRVYSHGYYVSVSNAVRPALKITDPKSANLQLGEKFTMFDHSWTVISNSLALCDGSIGTSPFRKDSEAGDANDYEESDVKKYMEAWFILECLTGGHKVNDADSYDLRAATKYAASHFPVDQLIRYLPQDVETPTPTEGEEPLWREWVGRGLEIHYCA